MYYVTFGGDPQTFKDFPDFLLEMNQPGLNLKHLCRLAVRNHLLNLDPHTHLFYRVPKLQLPSAMTQYLLFELSIDEDDDHNGANHPTPSGGSI